ncbi:MAG TPA: short-chain dehydrogenase [Bacteroidales bacterium]|nr:short-chain dehydrogenase [Bacteroidales bacterium]
MFDDVKDKVGIITGGNGRLGQTFAESLQLKNRVYLFDIQEKCSILKERVFYSQVDITNEDATRRAVGDILKKEKRIDFLINNAALQITNSFEKMTVGDFRRSIDVNLNAAYICIKAVCDAMISQQSGNIINIASMYGITIADPNIYGNSGLNSPDAYAASKAGLIHLTRYLAVNLAKYNIRVNSISPAGVFNNQPQEFLEKYLPKVPMNRMLNREELVGPLLFLLSDVSSYITGHNLVVDGGFSCL